MSVTAATFNALIEAALTAMAAEDWTTADNKLLAASTALTALPDTDADGLNIEYRSEDLAALRADVRKKLNAATSATSGSVQRTLQNIVNPTT